MIKEIINEEILKGTQKERKGMHISSVGSCLRKAYLDITHEAESEKLSAKQIRVFENGNYVHDRIRKYLKPILKEQEIPVYDKELGLSGSYDGVVIIEGKEVMIEIKSINSFMVDKPMENHVKQIMLYMHLSGIKKGVLLYESKPNQEIFEFEVDYDENIANEGLEFFRVLKQHIGYRKIPNISNDYDKGKYPCMWGKEKCPYWRHCYGDGMEQDMPGMRKVHGEQ